LNIPAAQFLAIYGRRRIGKTYLVRNFFIKKEYNIFDVAGTQNASLSTQIRNFTNRMGRSILWGNKY
jgi:hypothetical protein